MNDQIEFKCSRCQKYMGSDQFGLTLRKGTRSKICLRCSAYHDEYMRNKLAETRDFVLDDSWKVHPIYAHISCNKNGRVLNNVSKKIVGALTSNGYQRVTVSHTPTKCIWSHHLIWETFMGEIPEGKIINHKNEKKDDNRLENLEVVTKSENNILSTKKIKGSRPSKPCSGTDQETQETQSFPSMNEAERLTGCGNRSINFCADGQRNTVTSKTTGHKWSFRYTSPSPATEASGSAANSI